MWLLASVFIFHKTDYFPTKSIEHHTIHEIVYLIEFSIMMTAFSILILNIKLYRSFKKIDKQHFKWLTLSCFSFFIFIFSSNIINLFHNPSSNTMGALKIVYYSCYLYYASWLIFSLIFYYGIIVSHISIKRSSIATLCLLFLFSMGIIIFIGVSTVKWIRPISTHAGLGHVFLVMLSTFLYDITIACLINSKDRSIQLILIGTIIFIAATLWVMYAFIASTGYMYFHLNHKELIINLWVFGDFYALFGLIITLIGYFLLYHHKKFSINLWFRETNSIISRLVSLVFGISMASFILFFVFSYTFSIIDKVFFSAAPFFLIVYSIIVIIPSVFIGQYFEAPFKKIATNINILLNDDSKKTIDYSFSIIEFAFLQRFIMSSFDTIKEKIKIEKQLVDLASQVAHDIRSPLTALDMILLDLPEIDEEKRIIVRNANSRIRDIANNLLSKNNPLKKVKQSIEPCLLVEIIETCVSEKRFQLVNHIGIHLDFQPDQSSYDIFSKIHSSELGSIISNLLDNAIEALKNEGTIIVAILKQESVAIITIQDNGIGIPADILEKLGTLGLTYGKNNGHGLGVAHAISNITSWGGHIHFESSPGEGTLITLQLPLCPSPSWFLKKIVIHDHMDILILDDDSSIHHVWDRRFESLNLATKNRVWHHFYNETELASWLKNNDSNREKLILCDYEIIGSSKNGLDILESLGLQKNAILVTSRYQNKSIIRRCESLGIQILPKSLAIFVPILDMYYS